MPIDTTKYNHRHQSFYQTYRPHTSGQDIDSLYFCKISASILLDKILIQFTFAKYQPPYFWTRYQFSLLLQNIGLHTSGQDMTSSSEVHDKGDPFSKLLE